MRRWHMSYRTPDGKVTEAINLRSKRDAEELAALEDAVVLWLTNTPQALSTESR